MENISPILTDLYQLTMAQSYWKQGMAEKQAVFHLYFRKNPFGGNFTVACGINHIIYFINNFKYSQDDIEYLRSIKLFDEEFLQYLLNLKLDVCFNSVSEGEIVFPNEPVIQVSGPILQCQILETALLHIFNFQSLIATKARRILLAAEFDKVVEFGLRRAQNPLEASYAASVGGASGTSNVLAGKLYGLPIVGTHAHSWVMSFDSEYEAFKAWALNNPDNCIFLVDTYGTEQGIDNAIKVGNDLRNNHPNIKFKGVRLDSGDLLFLSRIVRNLLDRNKFYDVQIIASNDLDEYKIAELKKRKAPIDIWGVGTNLVTGGNQAALGGVYKLSALKNDLKTWQHKRKLSSDPEKNSFSGILDVRRNSNENGNFISDTVFDKLKTNVTSGVRLRNKNNPSGIRDNYTNYYCNSECISKFANLNKFDAIKKYNKLFDPKVFSLSEQFNYNVVIDGILC